MKNKLGVSCAKLSAGYGLPDLDLAWLVWVS